MIHCLQKHNAYALKGTSSLVLMSSWLGIDVHSPLRPFDVPLVTDVRTLKIPQQRKNAVLAKFWGKATNVLSIS